MLGFRVTAIVWRLFLAIISILGTVGLIHAQSEKTPVEVCGDLHTQAEMNDCAAAEAKRADAALNATYRELLSKVRENKAATQKVIAAEKAWIVFRDAELAAEWPVAEGENPKFLYGSVHPLCYSNELATMTWERVKTLKNLMRNEEGDICASGLAQNDHGDTRRGCNSDKGTVHHSPNARGVTVLPGE